jgi:hypothetical protein
MWFDLCHIAAHRIVNMLLQQKRSSVRQRCLRRRNTNVDLVAKHCNQTTHAFDCLLPSPFCLPHCTCFLCSVCEHVCVCVCVCGCVRASRIPFGDHPLQDGTIQRNISCPLRKDNTHNSGSVHFLACSVQVSRYAGKRHVSRYATLWTQRPRHLWSSGYDVSLTR